MPDANPYTPLQSALEGGIKDRPRSTKLAKLGAWLQLSPLIGVVGTVLGMMRAFSNVNTDGVGDPSQLSGAIGDVLISTAIGLFGNMIGCLILGLSLFLQPKQPFWVKVIFGVSIFLSLVGLSMLVA